MELHSPHLTISGRELEVGIDGARHLNDEDLHGCLQAAWAALAYTKLGALGGNASVSDLVGDETITLPYDAAMLPRLEAAMVLGEQFAAEAKARQLAEIDPATGKPLRHLRLIQ